MRRKPTLIHRGYLYAQSHMRPVPVFDNVTHQSISARRMERATDWRAGYLAALVDMRRASKNR